MGAVCQRMPVTIRRRLRALTSSPRWRLAMLLSAMLFVGASAAQDDEWVEASQIKSFRLHCGIPRASEHLYSDYVAKDENTLFECSGVQAFKVKDMYTLKEWQE